MHHFSTAHRLALAVICLGVLAFARPGVCAGIELSQAERGYLERLGPVTLCVDPDWTPFERINEQGQHEGIAADLLLLVSRRLGLPMQLVPTRNWEESLQASKDGRCMALSFLNQTPNREEWLTFTEPLFTDSNVFITREEHPFIADPSSLSYEAIVLPEGTSIEERIRREYPNLRVLTVATEQEAFSLVSEKKADMTMRSLIVAAYTIKKDGWFNLKIAGQLPNYANALRMGVVKTEPMLRDILNKGVDTITPMDRGQIVNKHVSINVQTAVDRAMVVRVVAIALAVVGVVLYWNRRLKQHNEELERRSQTDTLTSLPNRTRIDELFLTECSRGERYGRPFSVIMLDIDNFKRVNDEFGHQMGDKVLVATARAARDAVRTVDTLGRWGGEEFLVLCPETPEDMAVQVAERIRQVIAATAMGTGTPQTISAGVASLLPGDTPDALLQRADAALYQAKRLGRNRVCAA
ncbi:diguanylate cyclase [Megalodesulfovibrio gigas]|uniref:diguanylate cyclase n=1 Tax=Megalodesulfovibrio gigas TaxID=879 RepID=UPI0009DC01B4|nr:diguanylate cyclase [Megalodesulfovibrio gigas]